MADTATRNQPECGIHCSIQRHSLPPSAVFQSMPLPSPFPFRPVTPFAMPPLLVPWPKSAEMTGGLFLPKPCMSREAQATREKRARIILGEAEVEIATLFEEASHVYQKNPTALQLRAMNILFEGIKQKGALMRSRSSAPPARW